MLTDTPPLLSDAIQFAGSVTVSSPGAGILLFILSLLASNLMSFSIIGAATGCIAAALARGVALWTARRSLIKVGVQAGRRPARRRNPGDGWRRNRGRGCRALLVAGLATEPAEPAGVGYERPYQKRENAGVCAGLAGGGLDCQNSMPVYVKNTGGAGRLTPPRQS